MKRLIYCVICALVLNIGTAALHPKQLLKTEYSKQIK